MAGIALQRSIERRAYSLTAEYKAPVTTLGAFLSDEKAVFGDIKPSYKRGTELFDPKEYLPDYVNESLKAAISDFDAWMSGYLYSDAVLCGPETRTTSPVRVLRGINLDTVGIEGLYPAGEGAGYAGGIVSSARDGLLVAEKILEKA